MSALTNIRCLRTICFGQNYKISHYFRKYSNISCNKGRNVDVEPILFQTLLRPCNRSFSTYLQLNKYVLSSQISKYVPIRQFAIVVDRFGKPKRKPIILNSTNLVNETDVSEVHIDNLTKVFPAPKSTVNNFYENVSRELSRKDLKISSSYKLVKRTKTTNNWSFTYHVKWPEDMKFTRICHTKQEASTKAALDLLAWLQENNKITKNGQPILYSNEEVKDIRNSRIPECKLSKKEQTGLKELLDLYQNDMLPQLHNYYNNKENSGNSIPVEDYEKIWPKLRNYQGDTSVSYKACEPIKLPISDFKKKIKQFIDKNRVVIVKGEPGCGKSTRVPQYVLEYLAESNKFEENSNRIIVTQPRRIAAISLADRVASEREEYVGRTVGYQVRLQSRFNNEIGKIMYCTTGILLRRIQSDPKLTDCSYIILDEAHERDVNTDLLLNLLKHSLKANPSLKLIVMSATIDTNVFQKYFKDAATIHIPGFTYPVQVHFLDDIKGVDLSRTKKMTLEAGPNVVCEDVVKMIKKIHHTGKEGAILCFLPGWEEITRVRKLIPPMQDMSVLCLHSRLQDSDQKKIFNRVPPGVRKVILSTNIAETSVTIDDVVHVIDTGIHKEQRFDSERGIMCMDNHWISKSSMTQRKGRAGRVQAGLSYHLYPKAKYEQFTDYTMPEILRTSLTKIVLDSKVFSNNMNAMEFFEQLPCSPPETSIEKAIDELKELELLDENENLTPLGRTISNFQLEPKLSKAMVNSVIFKCSTPIVDIVTLFSADTELFESGLIDKEGVKTTKQDFCSTSDHISMMRLFEHWLNNQENSREICEENSLAQHKLRTMAKLRHIHFEYLFKGLNDCLPVSDDFSDCDEIVLGTLLSGVGNILTHRNWDLVKGRLKNTNVLVTKDNHKATISSESVHHKRSKFLSNFLVYINETRSNIRRTTLVREASIIKPLTMLLFKNSKLYMKDIPFEVKSHKSESNDANVLLRLHGTKVQVICPRDQAQLILECKDALNSSVQYFIHQLTEGNDYNREINALWTEILSKLNKLLNDNDEN